MNREIKNILVVNVNWLGDTVFATPVFKALKEYYPGCRVSCLCVPRVYEILQMSPFIDEIIIYDEKGRDWGIFRKWKIIQEIRRRKFDVAFLLRASISRALMLYAAGIPLRVGYKTKTPRFLLSHPVSPLETDVHRSEEYAYVVKSFQVPVGDQACELKVPQENLEKMKASLASLGLDKTRGFIVVNAGGNWDLKRWPAENFAALVKRLMRDFKESVLMVGAAKDLDLVEVITRLSGEKPFVLTGKTDLKDLAAIFSLAKLFICADTGPLHLASAVGCPSIALFGPTRPEATGPRGKGKGIVLQKDVGCNRAPCFHLACQKNVCMQSITVDDVLQTYQNFTH